MPASERMTSESARRRRGRVNAPLTLVLFEEEWLEEEWLGCEERGKNERGDVTGEEGALFDEEACASLLVCVCRPSDGEDEEGDA